jgi:zinc carboxypeptidase
MILMPRLAPLAFLGLCAMAAACLPATPAQAADNLLTNPGFESPLAPHWEKRTPEDKTRTLRRVDEAGRNDSAAAVLENLQPFYTRLRQGADRSIEIQPGSLIELSAWVRSEMTDEARITLQIYCMDEKGAILAQPRSPAMSGTFNWTRASAWTVVPQDTTYTMAYLQVQEGVGKVSFDDVELVVRQDPLPRPPAPKIVLFTDLPDDSPSLANLKTLFEDGLVQVALDAPSGIADVEGILILFEGEEVPATVCLTANAFAQSGGRVFMDIRNFAQWQAAQAVQVNVGTVDKASVEAKMQAGLRITSHRSVPNPTAGFQGNQIMPRASFPDGNLWALPKDFKRPGLQVLALTPDGHPGIVQLKVGKGTVVAADVLSLREPYCRNIDAYYKYAPITNTLTNPVPFGHYFPRKLKYAEFVDQMRAAADASPKIRFQEEGPACDRQPICSLNLGTPGKPLYFLYAAAHGSEWEPGYGLLCFAEQLADGTYSDVVDLDEVEVKIIPLLNPSGYDAMRRQNANGVDLNRQGDHQWERFQGRDSNKDGTWAPFDYDWKGSAPFSEPEAQVYRKIAEQENLYCVLDFHGNSSATSNKLAVLPATALPDNGIRAMHLQQIANARLRGRHLLRQNPEEHSKQYLLERVQQGGGTPFLMNTSAKDRYGVLIELTAGYPSSYGTVLQTDVTCELCRALFEAYPPEE